MKKPARGVAVSVRTKLLALAKERGEDFQLVPPRGAQHTHWIGADTGFSLAMETQVGVGVFVQLVGCV